MLFLPFHFLFLVILMAGVLYRCITILNKCSWRFKRQKYIIGSMFLCCLFFLTLNINRRLGINFPNFPLPHSTDNVVSLVTYCKQNSSFPGPFLRPKILRYWQNSQWIQSSTLPKGKHIFANSLTNSSNLRKWNI